MASKSVNITISTPLGDLQIYTDPKEQARAERLIAETPSIMRNAYDRATEKFGNQLLRLVKKCLRTGTPPRGTHWDPHSANTIKRYGEHTLLNYTGQYLRSVQIVKQTNRTYVGIPTNLKKTRKGERTSKRTLNQVAIMLEYGSRGGNLPPRPLWAPAFEQVGGKKVLKETIVRELRKEIRKYRNRKIRFRNFGYRYRSVEDGTLVRRMACPCGLERGVAWLSK